MLHLVQNIKKGNLDQQSKFLDELNKCEPSSSAKIYALELTILLKYDDSKILKCLEEIKNPRLNIYLA